ncbi:MAG: Fe-S cluster assembly protein SufD [Candidatus Dependentiae bacterium]|nr:Fe-S cluster assembly protein SufD [Candidatus Dependentiae bacterium]
MNEVRQISQVVELQENRAVTLTIPAGTHMTVFDDAMVMQATVTLVVEADATVVYKGSFVVAGGQVQRTVNMQCQGRGSAATLEVSCYTKGAGHFSLTTQQQHNASHSTSSARILGVSDGGSRATVASTIFIAPHLFGVAADQVHKHLLLDSGARAVSIPALDILSDDVSCSHGSAITHLDATQLFYLSARGYDDQEARDAMVKAFLMP